jgi:hypothetical protein
MPTDPAPIDIYTCPANPPLEYKIAVMQAALEGKPVQQGEKGGSIRGFVKGWYYPSLGAPAWNWALYDYRIDPASRPAPKKKLIPWTLETAPKGCVLLRDGHWRHVSTVWMILLWTSMGVSVPSGCSDGGKFVNWDRLQKEFEYSLDGGKTWAPCGTEVDE